MTKQSIVGERSVFSKDTVLAAVGDELLAIKTNDRLTWDDLAAVLGVSDVQAAKYVDGTATMGIVAYARAKREWNGRFTRKLDELCAASRPIADCDRTKGSKVLKAALALSIALEDDDEITPAEVRRDRAVLEQARDAIEAVLAKLTVRAA